MQLAPHLVIRQALSDTAMDRQNGDGCCRLIEDGDRNVGDIPQGQKIAGKRRPRIFLRRHEIGRQDNVAALGARDHGESHWID